MTRSIYLDNNATMPMLEEVKEALISALHISGNPSSIHQNGRQARQYLEESRQIVANYFSTKPSQVIFTSGATEANNLILKSFEGTIITTGIEHDSILSPLKSFAADRVKICKLDPYGFVDLNHLEDLLKNTAGPKLLSIMIANNETGVIQDMEQITTIAQTYGTYIHSDAVRAVGKISLDWKSLGLNWISLSAHKFGGPQGVGVLIADETYPLKPLISGGGQERSHRAGTENFLGIVGLGVALKACKHYHWAEIEKLRDHLETHLTNRYPEISIFGKSPFNQVRKTRLPNTTNIQMPGVKGSTQVMAFDLKGISVSSGSACSSGKVKTSQVLKAMGVDEPALHESIRVSLGLQTTARDIELFIEAWEELYKKHSKDIQK